MTTPPQNPYGGQPGYGYPQDGSGYSPQGQSGYPQGYPAYPQASPYGGMYMAPPGNGMAVAALVLGIVGIVLCWLWGLGGVLGLLGLIFGIVGIKRANRGAGRKGMAISGLVLGIIALILGGVFLTTEVIVVKKVENCVNQNVTQQGAQQCVNQEFGNNN